MPDGPLQDQINELERLARARFTDPPLSEAEQKLVRAAPKGEFAICGPKVKRDDPAYDPSKAEEWGGDREIRAELIRWLCVNRRAKELVDPRGIQLFGAMVSDSLDLDNVTIPFRLRLERCWLTQGLTLLDAQMPMLDLQGTRVRAITADRVLVNGTVFLRNGFHAEGEVRFLDSQIDGDLDCGGATFENPARDQVISSGNALNADRAVVKGGVFLSGGFRAKGEVRFVKAQIGVQLNCIGGTFENPAQAGGSGIALYGDRVAVNGDALLRGGLSAKGEVRFSGAQIGGDLDCGGATLENPPQGDVTGSGTALEASDAVVKGGVYLRNGFSARGDVRLLGAQIGGDLDCGGAKISGTVEAERAVIEGALFWRSVGNLSGLGLDLTGASVGALADDAGSWPANGRLALDGFVYGRISDNAPKDVASRLDWLKRQGSFTSQPYAQLAKVLREAGDEDGATTVLVEMERRQRLSDRWAERPVDWLLRWSVGYGYRPLRAIGGLTVLVGLGWIINRRALLAQTMTPTDPEAYEWYKKKSQPPAYYTGFSPLVYSVENSLPLVKLGQTDRWQPDPGGIPPPREPVLRRVSDVIRTASSPRSWGRAFRHSWCLATSPRLFWRVFLRTTASPIFLQRFLWFQIIAGWILATLFAAGVAGLIKH